LSVASCDKSSMHFIVKGAYVVNKVKHRCMSCLQTAICSTGRMSMILDGGYSRRLYFLLKDKVVSNNCEVKGINFEAIARAQSY